MKKIGLALLTSILLSSLASAAPIDCLNLQGNYSAFPGGVPTSPVLLTISYDPAKNELRLEYGIYGDSSYRVESYIADNAEHVGDGIWNGNFYTATCVPSAISIRKDFSPQMPNMVFTSKLYIEGVTLNQTDSFDDGSLPTLRGQYKRQ